MLIYWIFILYGKHLSNPKTIIMIAFIDIETGGFSKEKNGLCEIALIATDEKLNIIGTFATLIKPYKRHQSDELVSYKDDAMAVNKITIEDLEEYGIDIFEAMCHASAFIDRHQIDTFIGHNSKAFDIPWFSFLFAKFSTNNLEGKNQEDTMLIAKSKLNLPSYSLPNLLVYFDIENKNPHRAVGDAEATLELYKKLIQI